LLFLGYILKAIVYVDGFNLFYGCLKGTPHKWLDLLSLFEKVLGLITPGARKTSQQLRQHAHFVRTIRPAALSHSQLPDRIPGTSLYKPKSW